MKLSTKLVLLVSLITLFCSGAIAGIVAVSVHRLLDRELVERAATVASAISTDLVEKIVAHDSIAIREILQGLANHMEGTSFALVEGFDGEVLSHSLTGPLPAALTAVTTRQEGGRLYPPTIDYQGRRLKIIPLVLVDKMSARLVVAQDTAVAVDKIHTLVGMIGLAGLVMTAVGILLAAIFANLISRPLRRLAQSMEHFGEGEGEEIVLAGKGGGEEVMQLAQAFNSVMADRRRAERGLIASEEKFRTVANHIHNWEYWVAEDGGFVYVSPSCLRITGYRPEEFYQDPGLLLRIIHDDDRDLYDRHLLEVAAKKECPELEFRIIAADGDIRWLGHSCIEVFGGDGQSLGRRVSSRDITERKLAEKALRESEQQFRELFENVADPVYIADRSGRIIAANQQASLELGYNLDELRQCRIADLDAGVDAQAKFCALMSDSPAAHSVTFETHHRRKDGTLIPVEIKARLIDIGGQPCMLGVARNLTERKRIEEERLTMEKQLQQAQKMEAIGTLAGGIAHDFNNILGAIIGYAEMATEDCPPGSTVASDIDQVLKAGYRAKALVKQILAFSRHAETRLTPVQPATIIKETAKMLRSSMPSTIGIHHHVDEAAGAVLADPTQLQQIIMNLCTNAFHAMEETGGLLTISLTRKGLSAIDLPSSETGLQPGNFVRLAVADSGAGIAKELQDKIFEPYFTTKEVGKGTGMGLAIIHGIVKGCGGFITLRSELGKGTVFEVYLPAIDEADPAEPEPAVALPLGREHILLVDDELILAEMGKAMLERLGYRVTIKTDSSDALATFQEQPAVFDLVITDQTMPGLTGRDLARRLLQIRPDLPIILCTGYSSQITAADTTAWGIKGFALKPISRREIADLIREILDRDRGLERG